METQWTEKIIWQTQITDSHEAMYFLKKKKTQFELKIVIVNERKEEMNKTMKMHAMERQNEMEHTLNWYFVSKFGTRQENERQSNLPNSIGICCCWKKTNSRRFDRAIQLFCTYFHKIFRPWKCWPMIRTVCSGLRSMAWKENLRTNPHFGAIAKKIFVRINWELPAVCRLMDSCSRFLYTIFGWNKWSFACARSQTKSAPLHQQLEQI